MGQYMKRIKEVLLDKIKNENKQRLNKMRRKKMHQNIEPSNPTEYQTKKPWKINQLSLIEMPRKQFQAAHKF